MTITKGPDLLRAAEELLARSPGFTREGDETFRLYDEIRIEPTPHRITVTFFWHGEPVQTLVRETHPGQLLTLRGIDGKIGVKAL